MFAQISRKNRWSFAAVLSGLCSLFLATMPSLAANWPATPPYISNTGNQFAAQLVTINERDPAGEYEIRYTTDGTTPTASSTLYTTPFNVTSSKTIKAITVETANPTNKSTVTTSYIDVALAYLIGDAGVTIQSGNPAPVSTWADQSGNSTNATASGAARPTLNTVAINDEPGMMFDGSSQYFQLPSGFNTFSGGFSIFMVVKCASFPANAKILDLGKAGSGDNILMQISSSGSNAQLGVFSGTSGTFATSPFALTQNADQYQLLEAIFESGASGTGTFYINGTPGTANTSMNNIASGTRTSNYIGQASATGSYFPGTIAELVFFPNPLSSTSRTSVEAYFLQKYQLLSQVPPDPVFSVDSGTLNGPTPVVIMSRPDVSTHITLDNSTPTAASPVYDGCPIIINYTQSSSNSPANPVKAISIKNGVSSNVVTKNYTLDSGQWPAPSSSDTTAPTINLQLPAPTQ